MRPVELRWPLGEADVTPAGQRLANDKDVGPPVALVLVVVTGGVSPTGGEWLSYLSHQLSSGRQSAATWSESFCPGSNSSMTPTLAVRWPSSSGQETSSASRQGKSSISLVEGDTACDLVRCRFALLCSSTSSTTSGTGPRWPRRANCNDLRFNQREATERRLVRVLRRRQQ